MERILVVLLSLLGVAYAVTSFPDGALSTFMALALALPVIFYFRKSQDDPTTLINIFLLALLLRLSFGLVIHIFNLQQVFGPDAFSYDLIATSRVDGWLAGNGLDLSSSSTNSAWGMTYIVVFLYILFGKSMLVVQAFCGVIGALTPPMVFYCSKSIFNNKRVAVISGYSVAIFPSFIIWSSQMLKDGLIVFLLVVIMTMLIKLQKKLSYPAIAVLLLSMVGILSLRFYIFYMVVVAVAGSFLVGLAESSKSVIRNVLVLMLMGIGVAYIGVTRDAAHDLSQITDLERLQVVRQDLVGSANSGFADDADVSTVAGAVSTIPIGLIYLMFAPFPWQIGSASQALVFPETFIWWLLFPPMFSGFVYTLRNRLRPAIPIIVFSLMLIAAYSIFQGNVGMTYRQRTQIQVFLFMFISVGIGLILEKRENLRSIQKANRARAIRERILFEKRRKGVKG
ncbi:MAG: hypothetical protein R2684_15770 [Pyrinomonadaceae bacterium]